MHLHALTMDLMVGQVVLNGKLHVLVVAIKPIPQHAQVFVEYGNGYRSKRFSS
jgi:hypothetical protein